MTMPSKGIECYSYISIPDCTIEFSGPKVLFTRTVDNNFQSQHLEIEKKNIDGLWNFEGRFQWSVKINGLEIAQGYNMINTASGNPSSGTMLALTATQSIIVGNVIVTYGFYDAGPGMFGLSNAHQCYVTATFIQSDWMGAIAPVGSGEEQKPFSRFVLPSPHDGSMNSLENFDALLNGPNAHDILVSIFKQISEKFADVKLIQDVGNKLSVALAPNIVLGLAVTQKDTITTMLQLGARYFEFRPAFMENSIRQYSQFPDKLYFQHACIPGMLFEKFLEEIFTFLDTHPTEIVVLRVTWDGITSGCNKPSYQDVTDLIDAAIAGRTFKKGNEDQLPQPVKDLRANGQRFLFFFNNTSKYDSYDDESYATLSPDSIVRKFGTMDANGQNGAHYTVLQCQATATNIQNVLSYSIVSSNASTSCLLETKARCTKDTVLWAKDHALEKLTAEKNIVLMNDFLDGATVDVAIDLSKRRFAA